MSTTMTKERSRKRKKKQKKNWRSADTSDRYRLYEMAVQDPESEVDLIDQVWKERRGRLASSIREDFCGTAIASAQWVKHRPNNTAVAVDIDPEVLAWAHSKFEKRLTPEQRERLTVLQDNVLTVQTEPVDSVCAMNFSYYLFKTRKEMREYFERARTALVDDGLFLLDAYGGSEAFAEIEEERDLDGFVYVWDQHSYDPVTGEATNYIHFKFPDGSEMRNAFSYTWRLWTLPEIQEILYEAGFKNVTVYWEGTDDETEEGNGEFTPVEHGEACEGWIAYLVAEK